MSFYAGTIDRYDLSVRVIDRGGPVATEVKGGDGLLLSDCRHALLLIHGFNNSIAQANASYDKMIAHVETDLLAMKDGPDTIVCLQWPGNLVVSESVQVLDVLAYPLDVSQARTAAEVYADYFERLIAIRGPNFKISVIGHSMGCRLTLEMINELMARKPFAPRVFDVLGLMAAAVPVTFVDASGTANAYLAKTEGAAREIIKFHSLFDMVLGLAFPAGETLVRDPRIPVITLPQAVGYFGNPSAFGEGQRTWNTHGQYWGDEKVEKDVAGALDPTMKQRLTAPPRIGSRSIPARALSPRNAF